MCLCRVSKCDSPCFNFKVQSRFKNGTAHFLARSLDKSPSVSTNATGVTVGRSHHPPATGCYPSFGAMNHVGGSSCCLANQRSLCLTMSHCHPNPFGGLGKTGNAVAWPRHCLLPVCGRSRRKAHVLRSLCPVPLRTVMMSVDAASLPHCRRGRSGHRSDNCYQHWGCYYNSDHCSPELPAAILLCECWAPALPVARQLAVALLASLLPHLFALLCLQKRVAWALVSLEIARMEDRHLQQLQLTLVSQQRAQNQDGFLNYLVAHSALHCLQ